MSTAFHELRVRRVTAETADSRSFEFDVPASLADAYRYRAGQYLAFRIPWQDFEITRCYSLSSSPDLGEAPRVCVKRVPGGRVSNWMIDNLREGDRILAGEPEGRFVLDPDAGSSPLVFFAGGSGITPVLSLIKSALTTTAATVTLRYANRDRASVIYARELEELAAAHPARFVLRHHFDSESGFLTPEKIGPDVGPEDTLYYLCGPLPFMDVVERGLSEAGVEPERILSERFVSPPDPDRIAADAAIAATYEAPAAFSLWVEGRSRTVPYAPGRTLLQCAKDAGLRPPHSCESGYCGSCLAHVKSGKVHMRSHEALSPADVAHGAALLCQSVPASAEPLEVDCDAASFRIAARGPYGGQRSHPLAASIAFLLMLAGTLILRYVP